MSEILDITSKSAATNVRQLKIRNFLSHLPLFNEIELPELDRIAAGTAEIHVSRGAIVYQRGDPCVGFYSVVYGQVKLAFISPQGSEKVMEIAGPGHSFGEAMMFMDRPYIVSAQALADSLLLHVPKGIVFDELACNPQFARKMLAGLSRRLLVLMSDVEAYSLRSGTQRVISYLLDSHSREGGDQVNLQASKTVIASRLNLTPEHFSRILHDLSENSLICVSGKSITIPNVENLRAYSAASS